MVAAKDNLTAVAAAAAAESAAARRLAGCCYLGTYYVRTDGLVQGAQMLTTYELVRSYVLLVACVTSEMHALVTRKNTHM